MTTETELKPCPIPRCGGKAETPATGDRVWCSEEGCAFARIYLPRTAWQALPRVSGELAEVVVGMRKRAEAMRNPTVRSLASNSIAGLLDQYADSIEAIAAPEAAPLPDVPPADPAAVQAGREQARRNVEQMTRQRGRPAADPPKGGGDACAKCDPTCKSPDGRTCCDSGPCVSTQPPPEPADGEHGPAWGECNSCGSRPFAWGLIRPDHKPGDQCPCCYLDDYDCDGTLVSLPRRSDAVGEVVDWMRREAAKQGRPMIHIPSQFFLAVADKLAGSAMGDSTPEECPPDCDAADCHTCGDWHQLRATSATTEPHPLFTRLAALGPVERQLMERLLGRLELGRKRYGAMDLADGRDWRAEAQEELLDGCVYMAAALEQQQAEQPATIERLCTVPRLLRCEHIRVDSMCALPLGAPCPKPEGDA